MYVCMYAGYMGSVGLSGSPKAFLRDLKGDGVEKLCQTASVFHATVTAGDFLMMPSNYIVLERVSPEADCFGIKVSTVIPSDVAGFAFFSRKAGLPSTPDSHISKRVVSVAAVWLDALRQAAIQI